MLTHEFRQDPCLPSRCDECGQIETHLFHGTAPRHLGHYRHAARGSEYVVHAIAHLQTRHFIPYGNCGLHMEPLFLYQDLADLSFWLRPRAEFLDGRFVSMATALPSPSLAMSRAPRYLKTTTHNSVLLLGRARLQLARPTQHPVSGSDLEELDLAVLFDERRREIIANFEVEFEANYTPAGSTRC